MSHHVPHRPSPLAVAREWRARPGRREATHGGQPFIIVTGAGRSGTSAVARVLHESGVSMGTNLAAPSDANADGFYEDWGALWLNERILRDCGVGDRWRPERWPSRATVRAAARGHRDEMAALVANATDGWKDPRFSITLEAWLPLLPSRTKLIVCLRSPAAYAESVVRVYGLVDRAAAERQWARHYQRLLAVIHEHALEAICIEYDTLVERPEETVAALSSFIGRQLSAEHVNAPLRRYVHAVPERYRTLYDQVLGLSPLKPAPRIDHPRDDATGVEISSAEVTRRAAEIAGSVRHARREWETNVGMPKPATSTAARTASEAYRSVLCETQRELATLPGAPHLARDVDLQRMIVELTIAAMAEDDPRTMRAAVRAWKRFGRSTTALAPSA
jgi:hypothetical protein